MNTNLTKPQIIRYSLGTEEFSLALAMAGGQDQGRAVLASAYKNNAQIDTDSLLSSASHSLLARGYCTLSSNTQPALEKNFNRILSPLINFIEVVYLNLVTAQSPLELTIHINPPKDFCSHLNKGNMVHLLEYGTYKSLGAYLVDSLQDAVAPSSQLESSFNAEIPLSVLANMPLSGENQNMISDQLQRSSWPSRQADMLSESLQKQIIRGTIIRVKTKNIALEDEIVQAPKSTLLFLKGADNTWIFNFESLDSSATGKACLVDLNGFKDAIINFVR